MARLYKASEWNIGKNWYVSDVSDLVNDSGAWWIPARFLNLSFEEYILKLKDEHHAIIDKFYPESNKGKSLLIFHWDNYSDAHKYLLWINRMARNGHWTI